MSGKPVRVYLGSETGIFKTLLIQPTETARELQEKATKKFAADITQGGYALHQSYNGITSLLSFNELPYAIYEGWGEDAGVKNKFILKPAQIADNLHSSTEIAHSLPPARPQPLIGAENLSQKLNTLRQNSEEKKQKVDSAKRGVTNWLNSHLSGRGIVVSNLETDLKDGVALCNLIEVLTNVTLNYDPHPNGYAAWETNLELAFTCLRGQGLRFQGCSAQDYINGNINPILGMMLILIKKFNGPTGGFDTPTVNPSLKQGGLKQGGLKQVGLKQGGLKQVGVGLKQGGLKQVGVGLKQSLKQVGVGLKQGGLKQGGLKPVPLKPSLEPAPASMLPNPILPASELPRPLLKPNLKVGIASTLRSQPTTGFSGPTSPSGSDTSPLKPSPKVGEASTMRTGKPSATPPRNPPFKLKAKPTNADPVVSLKPAQPPMKPTRPDRPAILPPSAASDLPQPVLADLPSPNTTRPDRPAVLPQPITDLPSPISTRSDRPPVLPQPMANLPPPITQEPKYTTIQPKPAASLGPQRAPQRAQPTVPKDPTQVAPREKTEVDHVFVPVGDDDDILGFLDTQPELEIGEASPAAPSKKENSSSNTKNDDNDTLNTASSTTQSAVSSTDDWGEIPEELWDIDTKPNSQLLTVSSSWDVVARTAENSEFLESDFDDLQNLLAGISEGQQVHVVDEFEDEVEF